jgi:predicted  nucleic acid-binding Zn-ribbon protein
MPHRCVECKNVLESRELDLEKGCPVCGGKKFQYIRESKGPEEKDLRKLTVAEPPPKAAVPGVTEKEKKPGAGRIESVRILEKGSYDLNLPVLLSRKELVMSKEDGVYVVDLPSALKTPSKKKRRQRQKEKK